VSIISDNSLHKKALIKNILFMDYFNKKTGSLFQNSRLVKDIRNLKKGL